MSEKQLTLWGEKVVPVKKEEIHLTKITRILKIGAVVAAAEDIHFSGDGTMIVAGTLGKITSSGLIACNVHFEGYSENHDVLCLWDMLLVAENQPCRTRKIAHLPKWG